MAQGGTGEAVGRGVDAPSERRGLGRTFTERRQRARLEAAMIEAVSRHGYPETTVAELVGIAAVSKSTFYAHFRDKEDCFFVTFDTIMDEVAARVGVAFRSQTGLERRLAAGFTKFADFLVNESDAASLVVVDSLALGSAVVPHLERASESFEVTLRKELEGERRFHGEPTPLAVRAIVGGIRTVIYKALRSGRPEELLEHAEALLSWALAYMSGERLPHPVAARPLPPNAVGNPDPEEIPWSEPADSPLSRAQLSQRQRILRATAQAATKLGYAHLTIPAISTTAGTSNQTFYQHFESKEQAFIQAFERVGQRALTAIFTAAATESEWQAIVEVGMRGFLEYLASEPLFARLAFFELPTAGATALDHGENSLQSFTGFLEPEALPPGIPPLPPVQIEAIGGAIWWTIQREIAAGNLEAIPDMAPEICDLVFVPLRNR
jgi:AcrR family transcriptional regulator